MTRKWFSIAALISAATLFGKTVTVLQNVAVLATGQRTEHSATGEPQNASVVTLLVSPEDSEKLALASLGRIQLVLRNPLDTSQEKAPVITHANLFGSSLSAQRRGKVTRVKHALIPPSPSEPMRPLEIDVIQGNHSETIQVKQ